MTKLHQCTVFIYWTMNVALSAHFFSTHSLLFFYCSIPLSYTFHLLCNLAYFNISLDTSSSQFHITKWQSYAHRRCYFSFFFPWVDILYRRPIVSFYEHLHILKCFHQCCHSNSYLLMHVLKIFHIWLLWQSCGVCQSTWSTTWTSQPNRQVEASSITVAFAKGATKVGRSVPQLNLKTSWCTTAFHAGWLQYILWVTPNPSSLERLWSGLWRRLTGVFSYSSLRPPK